MLTAKEKEKRRERMQIEASFVSDLRRERNEGEDDERGRLTGTALCTYFRIEGKLDQKGGRGEGERKEERTRRTDETLSQREDHDVDQTGIPDPVSLTCSESVMID